MGVTLRRERVLGLLVPLAVAALLLAGLISWRAPGADADTDLGASGTVATNFLFDDPSSPGAQCSYDSGTGVFSVSMTPPFVMGLNRDSSDPNESTAVSWRAILFDSGVQVEASARQAAAAYENQSAGFTAITFHPANLFGSFSIQIVIEWWDQIVEASDVLGTAPHQVDYYLETRTGLDPYQRTVTGACHLLDAPSPTPTNTPLPTDTPVPTATATATPTPTATSTPLPTVTPDPNATATATPSPTTTPIPTNTPTATATASPTRTPTTPAGSPRITLSATRGIVAYRLGVTLAGFPARKTVKVSFAGSEVISVTTDSAGNAALSFAIPAKPKGTYPVKATYGSKSATANFELVPRIKLLPGSGARGSTVNVSLRGYAAGERVRIRWLLNGRWVEVAVVAKTSSTGSANVNITIPTNATVGLQSVRGDGTVGRAETNAFRVT